MNGTTIILLSLSTGVLAGWCITRLILGQRIASLKAMIALHPTQLLQITEESQHARRELDALRSQFSEQALVKTRAETIIGEQLKRNAELLQELQSAKAYKDQLEEQLRTSREAHTFIKAKHDNLFADNIETTNEKNRLKSQVEQQRLKESELNSAIATLTAKYEEAQKAIAEQKEFVEAAKKTLKESFDSLSADALNKNNEAFLKLARTALDNHVTEAKGDLEKRQQAIDSLVKPLNESLNKMDEKINHLESKREGAYGSISTLLDQVRSSTLSLDKETRNLVTALKTSHTRGRYGEIALRRLVEFAGMTDQCDFAEQESADTETGRLRPDMIIRLPGNRQAVVDSKVPLSAYLSMFETDDAEQQKIFLARHVSAIKMHIRQLSAKAYWDQFKDAPDFVILFMQIESSFGAALSFWPELIEEALNNRIIVATPTTLITILRSIGYGWNQLKTIENIEQIRDAAVELYERSAILAEHIAAVGKSLQSTVTNYNKTLGSLESSFMPQGRRIHSLSQAYVKKQLPDISPVETAVRAATVITPPASLPLDDRRDPAGI